MNGRALLLAALGLLIFPVLSRAQERGQVGLTMGFPTSAGFIWHATDGIAVRPEITFLQITSKAELTPPSESTETTQRSVGVGASVLWYVGSFDDVRTYVSPRIVYNRATSRDSRRTANDEEEAPVGSLVVSGALGVQYTPSRRVGIFGEIGFSRARQDAHRSDAHRDHQRDVLIDEECGRRDLLPRTLMRTRGASRRPSPAMTRPARLAPSALD